MACHDVYTHFRVLADFLQLVSFLRFSTGPIPKPFLILTTLAFNFTTDTVRMFHIEGLVD